MKGLKITAKVLMLVGILLAAATVYICLNALKAPPVMVEQPTGAVERAETMMNAVCQGDYGRAGKIMYGKPSLGMGPEDNDSTEGMIWNAFIESIQYEFPGECYAAPSGVALDMKVNYLDISSVTDGLKARAEELLNQRVAEAKNVSEIYDKDNNYREDFVMDILRSAAVDALAQDAKTLERTVSLRLVYENSQWWVVPEAGLMNLLSGALSE